MHDSSISRFDFTVLCLFSGALLLLLYLKLLPALLGGLLVYALVNVLVPKLQTPAADRSRLLAVALLAVVVIGLFTVAGFSLASFLRGSGETVPGLLQRMAEIIENSRGRLPAWFLQYFPENADALRQALVNWLRGHTDMFQVAGAGAGRTLAHVLIGMVIGALLSLESAAVGHEHGPVTESLARRALGLADAFRRVVFAQVWISAINTTLTALYLAVVLPAFGVNLPFTKTLIMVTFVVGLLPILGNLVSNTVIFIVSLRDRKSTRLNSSHIQKSRMPSSA